MRLCTAILLGFLTAALGSAQVSIPATAYRLRIIVTNGAAKRLPDVTIQLDGNEIGETDETGEFYLLRNPTASEDHLIHLSLTGFKQETRTVTLPTDPAKPGADLKVVLTPAPKGAPQSVTRGGPETAEPNYEIVQIFYATDRQDTGSAIPGQRFANRRSQPAALKRGTCDVSIPRDHRLGSLEEPSLLRLEYQPDPNKHVMLQRIDPLLPDAFYKKLAAKIARSSHKEAVVFVHGYNVSFENAARRTAQLAYDIGFDGAPILYSWPSRNKTLAYTEDEDTVQWTAFHLREFLDELAVRTSATKIHLIAHSMGNRALASALQVIAAERHGNPKPLFRQLVLAAPDIGADTVALLSKEIAPLARRITLYASASDDALIFSQMLHGVLRAGESGKYLIVTPGIDTVDASAVKTDFLGHSYFGHSNSIVADIRKILSTEAPPEKRKLLPAESADKLPYWIVPLPKLPTETP